MIWKRVLRIGVELAIDLAREALSNRRKPERTTQLTHRDVEHQQEQIRSATAHKVEPKP